MNVGVMYSVVVNHECQTLPVFFINISLKTALVVGSKSAECDDCVAATELLHHTCALVSEAETVSQVG